MIAGSGTPPPPLTAKIDKIATLVLIQENLVVYAHLSLQNDTCSKLCALKRFILNLLNVRGVS